MYTFLTRDPKEINGEIRPSLRVPSRRPGGKIGGPTAQSATAIRDSRAETPAPPFLSLSAVTRQPAAFRSLSTRPAIRDTLCEAHAHISHERIPFSARAVCVAFGNGLSERAARSLGRRKRPLRSVRRDGYEAINGGPCGRISEVFQDLLTDTGTGGNALSGDQAALVGGVQVT
ncbi:hypothetical protein SKAU_G00367110 [Synaphobranchus kaupii]|uniref:Uncharacterized protein n=1 Tax=Synaphobranchus kaupii TaxID=118154 RepID=A0A9Q1EFF2_SYNKA|nr:hypothetical protein SKAU_G00367110 [Synaphobranchus kaupii]